MLSLLGTIDQSLKAGKKQSWRAATVTNICVGLLAGLKVLHIYRYISRNSVQVLYMTGAFVAGFGYITSSAFGTWDNKFGTSYFSGIHHKFEDKISEMKLVSFDRLSSFCFIVVFSCFSGVWGFFSPIYCYLAIFFLWFWSLLDRIDTVWLALHEIFILFA